MASQEKEVVHKKQAYVTLATNDSYALGALVLGHALRRTKTSRSLCVMISSSVSSNLKTALQALFNHMIEVDVLDSGDATRLALLNRPDLGLTFTKIRCWLLEQFEKCVFLDADTLVVQNIDELFEREELSAAPDAGWPDCFNSGVFVLRPSKDTYEKLIAFALQHGSFDGGDQGLLNEFFKDWATTDPSKKLPFIYNVVSQAFYSYLPAFTRFQKDIKVVHFIGAVKPWLHMYDRSTHQVRLQLDPGHQAGYLQQWWDIFMQDVEPCLAPQAPSKEGPNLISGATYTPGGDDSERQYSWEEGEIDYMGRDAFTNIKQKLDHTIGSETSKEKE
jgi:glycogenin glucosyltransferase